MCVFFLSRFFLVWFLIFPFFGQRGFTVLSRKIKHFSVISRLNIFRFALTRMVRDRPAFLIAGSFHVACPPLTPPKKL
jgi:hypothetical protein